MLVHTQERCVVVTYDGGCMSREEVRVKGVDDQLQYLRVTALVAVQLHDGLEHVLQQTWEGREGLIVGLHNY